MKISEYLKSGHWQTDIRALPAYKRIPLRLFRFLSMSLGIFSSRRGKLHAGALTYFTLTTIVPVICLILLAAKQLGAGEFARRQINTRIEEAIDSFERDSRILEDGLGNGADADGTTDKESSPSAAETVQPGGAAAAAPDSPGSGNPPAADGRTGPGQDMESAACAGEDKRARAKVMKGFAVQAREFSNKLFDQIRDFDIGTLGIAGVLLLVWTVIGTLGCVEQSFNDVWDIPRPRSLLKRTWYYLLVLAILPILVCAASAVPLVRALSGMILSAIDIIPYADCVTGIVRTVLDSPLSGFAITLFASAFSFAFFLWAMPNAKTRFKCAFKSGILTCVLFGGWMKLCAVAQVGISKSSAIYGSFSFLPIVLAWVYVSWEIVLLGAAFSRVIQHGTDTPV